MIIGIILNFTLSLWIIPKYIGTRRRIGYTNSALACTFLTPLIGLIITLCSPKIGKVKSQSNEENNLIQLKKQGILNDHEFKDKLHKIKIKQSEDLIVKSMEFNQLKGLLDSGILNQDEFNKKMEFIREKYSIVNPTLKYRIKFIDNHHSFTNGNYKAFIITWENGFEHKFFIKNSTKEYFLEEKRDTLRFKTENDFLKYSYKVAQLYK